MNPLPSKTNYLLGSAPGQWRKGVAQYGRVRYQDVYRGIDLDYYGTGRSLEYDFLVHPGADPGQIRLRFHGADRIALTPSGDLAVHAGDRVLVEKRPVVYQRDGAARQAIAGRYRLLGQDTVAIQVAAYDRARDLVIDPVLSYGTLIGGSGEDVVTAVAADSAGFIYVAGYTDSTDIPNMPGGAAQATQGGKNDIFVAKFDPHATGAASLVYLTYLGGSGDDVATAMALDASGNIYLTGYTTSTNFPTAGSAGQTTAPGSTDSFVVKLTPALGGTSDLAFSTYLGGADKDIGYAIAVDKAGLVYVAGSSRSTDMPVTSNAYTGTHWGNMDAFIGQLNPSASPALQYLSYIGGENDDEARAIVVKDAAHVYVAGNTVSTQFPAAGAQFQTVMAGQESIWIAGMDLTQTGGAGLVYSTYLGGSTAEEVRAMALDPAGRLVLTGYTLSPDFPITPNARQQSLTGSPNAFVTQIDISQPRDKQLVYSSYLGGSLAEVGLDVAADSAGNVYVTGYTYSHDFPTTAGALQTYYGGGVDVFLVKLNGPELLYSTYLGTNGVYTGQSVFVGGDGTMYLGGMTSRRSIQTTSGGFDTSYSGGVTDGYLLVLGPQQQ